MRWQFRPAKASQTRMPAAGFVPMFKTLTAGARVRPDVLCLLMVLLAGLPLFGGALARSQAAAERWVSLATRTIDTRSGRTNIDLKRAKGAFKAVRVAAKAGAIMLTHVELKWSDGTVQKVRRSLILAQGQTTPALGARRDEAFLDHIVLVFRGAAGELDSATLEIAGLQSPQGAAAVRPAPPPPAPSDPAPPDKSTPGQGKGGEETDRSAPGEVAGKPARAPRQAPATETRKQAEPPEPVPATRGMSEPWDVVPVFY